jgi:adenylate cyclase class 2
LTATNNQEQEAKFYIGDRPALTDRLNKLGAQLRTPRVFEVNLRFDTADGALTSARQVLRLRQDEKVRLTYKGPAEIGRQVSIRPEIEFEVSSFENAQAFLEALGYQVSVRYDKYRTTYDMGSVEVVMDELPFGDFAEIEGPNTEAIQTAASALGLEWEERCIDSYLGLFTRLKMTEGLVAQNLTFEEVGKKYPAEAFGLKVADLR